MLSNRRPKQPTDFAYQPKGKANKRLRQPDDANLRRKTRQELERELRRRGRHRPDPAGRGREEGRRRPRRAPSQRAAVLGASTTSVPMPRPRRWLSAPGAAPAPAAGREGEARHLAGKEAGGRRRMQGGVGSAADGIWGLLLGASIGEKLWVCNSFTVRYLNCEMGLRFGFMLLESVLAFFIAPAPL